MDEKKPLNPYPIFNSEEWERIQKTTETARNAFESINDFSSALQNNLINIQNYTADIEKNLTLQVQPFVTAASLVHENLTQFGHTWVSALDNVKSALDSSVLSLSGLNLVTPSNPIFTPNLDYKTTFDFPVITPSSLEATFKTITSFNFDLNSISPIEGIANHFNVFTASEISNGSESIVWRENTELRWEIVSLKNQIFEKGEIIEELKRNHSHELTALHQYYLAGGSPLIRVHDIKFVKKDCQLLINDKIIEIESDSNQFYVCKMLFEKNNKFTKKFDALDFIEVLGERDSSGKADILYQTARHLNTKIASVTRISDLILYKDKKIFLNIKYFQS